MLFTIKVEKEDVRTSKIGLNYMIQHENVAIIFSPEALDELIKDYKSLKIEPQNLTNG